MIVIDLLKKTKSKLKESESIVLDGTLVYRNIETDIKHSVSRVNLRHELRSIRRLYSIQDFILTESINDIVTNCVHL